MKIDKNIAIELRGDAEEAYNKLNQVVGKQKTEGKDTSEEIKLWNGIQRAFDLIKENILEKKKRQKSG